MSGREEEESGRSVKGEIVSVILVSEYLSCKFCRCKATVECNAECTKCGTILKVPMYQEVKAAKIVGADEMGSRQLRVLIELTGSTQGYTAKAIRKCIKSLR